jgi:hypothetical protein
VGTRLFLSLCLKWHQIYTTIITSLNTTAGIATVKLEFPTGTYDLAINYTDLIGGKAYWQVSLNEREVGEWIGNYEDTLGHAVSANLDGHTASQIRIIFKGVLLGCLMVPKGLRWTMWLFFHLVFLIRNSPLVLTTKTRAQNLW